MSIPSRALPIVTSPPFYVYEIQRGSCPCGNASKGSPKIRSERSHFPPYKYCETHFFDYPDLKQALESKGIPTLLLEWKIHLFDRTIEDSCSGICRNAESFLALRISESPSPHPLPEGRGEGWGQYPLIPNPHSAFRTQWGWKSCQRIIPKPILTGK